jgi:hypothetical protein
VAQNTNKMTATQMLAEIKGGKVIRQVGEQTNKLELCAPDKERGERVSVSSVNSLIRKGKIICINSILVYDNRNAN